MFALQRVKNDERDAADMTDLLWMGWLPEAWIAPPATRELRGWVRHRATLVGLRSNLKCRVHAVWAVSRIVDSSSWLSWPGCCSGLVVAEGFGLGAVGESGVQPPAVVEDFDVFRDGEPGLRPSIEPASVVHLVLQGGKERLCCGVVPAHPGPPDAGLNLVAGAEAGELMRGRR